MLTRLHVRYQLDRFPEDLQFQETQDQQNYQARYVLRHAWKGDANACPEAKRYFEELPRRYEHEAEVLANLTGWDVQDIRKKLLIPAATTTDKQWWQRLWKE
jgi:hypothetical protein